MDFPKNLHHAYIIEGDVKASRGALFNFLNNNFEIRPGNPDLFLFSTESFGVEDTKWLIEANMRKPVSAVGPAKGKKFLVVDFSSISIPAQNSLLKILEEPYPGTYILILTETSSVFLPTVLSRVHVLSSAGEKAENNENKEGKNEKGLNAKTLAEKFLSAKAAERIEIIKTLMAGKEDEKIRESDIEKFAVETELLAHKYFQQKSQSSNGSKDMAPFLIVDEYMRDTSSSLKMLLEYLALTLPESFKL